MRVRARCGAASPGRAYAEWRANLVHGLGTRIVQVRCAPRRRVEIGGRALAVHMRSGVVHGCGASEGALGGHRIASGSLSRPHRTDAIELATLMEALQEGVTSDWCCARPARRHVGLICNPHTCVDASLESLPDRQSRSQIGRRCRFLSSDHRGGCLGVDGSKSGNDRPTAFLHLG